MISDEIKQCECLIIDHLNEVKYNKNTHIKCCNRIMHKKCLKKNNFTCPQCNKFYIINN